MKPLFHLVAVLTAVGLADAQPARSPTPAIPLNAVDAILDAFRSHSLVALGEPHGNEQAALFRVALIRDPRFAEIVDDIVVESGNSRYQDIVDRFVAGRDVPDPVLRRAWQDTTVANFLWDRPIYEQFFRAVREVNGSRPPQRRLRILLGDPPIDWSAVHTVDELTDWLRQRDASPASIIRKEVLDKHRRALVIFGEGHFWRHNGGNNLVCRIEAEGTPVFTISSPITADLASLQPDVALWPQPSLALLRGTVIGDRAFADLFPGIAGESVRVQDQVDAVLYLGPPATMTTSMLPAALCADERYVAMRLARMALDPGPPGSSPSLDRLRRNCATK